MLTYLRPWDRGGHLGLGRLGQMLVLVLMLPRPNVASEYGLCRSPEPALIVVPSLLLEQFFWASLDLGLQAYA